MMNEPRIKFLKKGDRIYIVGDTARFIIQSADVMIVEDVNEEYDPSRDPTNKKGIGEG
jgi:hypothetical protein